MFLLLVLELFSKFPKIFLSLKCVHNECGLDTHAQLRAQRVDRHTDTKTINDVHLCLIKYLATSWCTRELQMLTMSSIK